MEEPILAERLLQAGYNCACCLETEVIHNHSTTVKQSFDKYKVIRIQNKSYEYLLYKYRHFNFIQVFMCKLFNLLKYLYLYNRGNLE